MPIPDRLNPTFATTPAPAPATFDPLEEARQRLIVALDVATAKAALDLVNELEVHCCWFKVGLELFVAAGPKVIEPIVARGHKVFPTPWRARYARQPILALAWLHCTLLAARPCLRPPTRRLTASTIRRNC
jgi:hypothetical protein